MSHVKIAVLGAGSFVFGPSVLAQALLENRLDGIELALMDVDADTLEAMAGIGRRMAREQGLDATISTHGDWDTALEGAQYVINAACREIHRRYALDCEIIDRVLPGHLVTEFGGVAGISYSLRQIAMVEEIAARMKVLCPSAWLLDVANPLPRVCQAACEAGIQTAGFCAVSESVYQVAWKLLEGETLPYPWEPARERYQMRLGGTNHFCWLLEIQDRQTGADLYPALRSRVAAGASAGNPRCESFVASTGFLLLPNDRHTSDFLVPEGAPMSREEPSHGTQEERPRRLRLLQEIAAGQADYAPLLAKPSWERPLDWIAAREFEGTVFFSTMNLVNTGQVTHLPKGVFVETGCMVSRQEIAPDRVALPESVVFLSRRTAQVSDTIVRAAQQRSRRLLQEAVELDPTILDKEAGFRALEACLEAHRDVLPVYGV